MIITTFGTRGSLPVCSPDRSTYGGNTTCIRVESDALPRGLVLCVDAGTGLLPLAWQALREGVDQLFLLHTHYHFDHTQGFLIAPLVYIKSVAISIIGPVLGGMGPKKVYQSIVRPPFHPVPFGALADHITFTNMVRPEETAIVFHKEAGTKVMRSYKSGQKTFDFGGKRLPANECLVVTSYPTDHPGGAVAYRFDEGPTGKSFVFMTDEEVRSKIPRSLIKFLSGSHLVIQDAQYEEEVYKKRTRGFGHGTPNYALELARRCRVGMIGFTHHDPQSTDEDVERLIAGCAREARLAGVKIFACKDYMRIEI